MLVSIQIGNSDNKLTQKKWSEFVESLNQAIEGYQTARHFFGGSITWAEWQNVCWVVEIEEEDLPALKRRSARIRAVYQQDSVCILVGKPEFV